MKHLFFSILLSFACLVSYAQSPEVFLDLKGFYSQDEEAYVEAYMTVAGNSVVYIEDEYGQYQSRVELTLLVKQDDEIIDFIKKDLLSPASTDSSLSDFIDVHRFVLPDNGTYEFELTAVDMKREEENQLEYTSKTTYSIDFDRNKLSFSDIVFIGEYNKTEMANAFSRSGYDIYPNTTNYFAPDITDLSFYAELYNSDIEFQEDSMFLLTYFIRNHSTGEIIQKSRRLQRLPAKDIQVLMHKIDIETIPTGNYNLVIEARDKNNELIADKRIFFYRYNKTIKQKTVDDFSKEDVFVSFVSKIESIDSLREHTRSLRPIGEQSETNFIDNHMETTDEDHLRKFFYTFWYNRYPDNPEYAWNQYHEEVKKVERYFGTRVRKGYETDMGRVYLKYGPPNDIADRPNEPSAYPYQIWHYFKIGKYNNKRFVFYSPEMVTQEYVLLHSDVPGEVRDPRWSFRIHSRTSPNTNIDQQGMRQQHWGGNIDEFWDLPR